MLHFFWKRLYIEYECVKTLEPLEHVYSFPERKYVLSVGTCMYYAVRCVSLYCTSYGANNVPMGERMLLS